MILNFRMVNAYAYFSRSIRVQSPRLQQFLSENDAELIRNIIRNEVQLSETRIKTEISDFKREVKTESEESVRRKVAKLNGESWAESITFKSLDDLAAFISPSLLQNKKIEVSECKVLLARRVHPLLGMYLDRVKAYLKDYSSTLDDAAVKEKLKNVLAIKDDEKLIGQLISFFGTNIKNETWRSVLVRFKKASHLIKVVEPTNDHTGIYWYPPVPTGTPPPVLTGTNCTNSGTEGVKRKYPHPLIISTRCTNIVYNNNSKNFFLLLV